MRFVTNEFRCNPGTILYDPYASEDKSNWMFITCYGDMILVVPTNYLVKSIHDYPTRHVQLFHEHEYCEWRIKSFGRFAPQFNQPTQTELDLQCDRLNSKD